VLRINRAIIGIGLLLSIPLIISSGSSSSLQDTSSNSKTHHYWVNLGSGIGWVDGGLGEDPGGISGGAGFSYQTGPSLLSIRWVAIAELQLDLWGTSGPAEGVWDVGALYGRIAKTSWGLASVSAGLSLVGVSDNKGVSTYHPGIPVESQLFWTPTSAFGIGLYAYGNLNSKKSFFGALLCLQIGKLR
jgi:hypothetical protein